MTAVPPGSSRRSRAPGASRPRSVDPARGRSRCAHLARVGTVGETILPARRTSRVRLETLREPIGHDGGRCRPDHPAMLREDRPRSSAFVVAMAAPHPDVRHPVPRSRDLCVRRANGNRSETISDRHISLRQGRTVVPPPAPARSMVVSGRIRDGASPPPPPAASRSARRWCRPRSSPARSRSGGSRCARRGGCRRPLSSRTSSRSRSHSRARASASAAASSTRPKPVPARLAPPRSRTDGRAGCRGGARSCGADQDRVVEGDEQRDRRRADGVADRPALRPVGGEGRGLERHQGVEVLGTRRRMVTAAPGRARAHAAFHG